MGQFLVSGYYVFKEMEKTLQETRDSANPIPLVDYERVFDNEREARRYVRSLGFLKRYECVTQELPEGWSSGFMRYTTFPVDKGQSNSKTCIFREPEDSVGVFLKHNRSYGYVSIVVYGRDFDLVNKTFKRESDFVALAYG